MHAMDVVIVSALRTAIGSFGGSLVNMPAHEMAKNLIIATLANTKIQGQEIDEVILGQILTANCGQNPSRQAAIGAGLPIEIPAWQINQVCGSGLRAVALAYQAILAGQGKVILAGGIESMTQSPHAVRLRDGIKMGTGELQDTMMRDGLTCAFSNTAMGVTAENIAKQFNISREAQDLFALNSQQKAQAAIREGRFSDEIVPLTVTIKREEKTFEQDEFPRADLKLEDLAKLRPAFVKDGTVTAGNSSGINDGAALLMVMTRAEAERQGLKPLATIKSFASAGVAPEIMGTGPIPACRKALATAGWNAMELDLIEANEAFAAQAIAVNTQLGFPADITNVNGGAIALGHPIGASGARILVTLLHEMKRRDAKKGLATLCVGGGMGVAMCLERE